MHRWNTCTVFKPYFGHLAQLSTMAVLPWSVLYPPVWPLSTIVSHDMAKFDECLGCSFTKVFKWLCSAAHMGHRKWKFENDIFKFFETASVEQITWSRRRSFKLWPLGRWHRPTPFLKLHHWNFKWLIQSTKFGQITTPGSKLPNRTIMTLLWPEPGLESSLRTLCKLSILCHFFSWKCAQKLKKRRCIWQ